MLQQTAKNTRTMQQHHTIMLNSQGIKITKYLKLKELMCGPNFQLRMCISNILAFNSKLV